MQASSRPPHSNQPHLHPKLAATVRKHLESRSRKPISAHNAQALQRLLAELARQPRPLVLDSFCGTGLSTQLLARRHPGQLVVGLDKSAHRLAKHPQPETDGYLLLRCECEEFWRLLAEAGLAVSHHYLLYPNPWPKASQLQRRVHGSAGFYWLLELAKPPHAGAEAHSCIELRSNWQIYVEEFGTAMSLAGHTGKVALFDPPEPMTLFERKYRDSGHKLWAFTANLRFPSGQPHADST